MTAIGDIPIPVLDVEPSLPIVTVAGILLPVWGGKMIFSSWPSGSVNRYGLLFAYMYRSNFAPESASVDIGSMLRKRPAIGS
jgi:hypothetical protein